MADVDPPRDPEPKASRPRIDGYGVPQMSEGMLPWEWAQERLSKSHNYWLTTARPDCAPHTMPVWGIWLKGAWYCSTGPKTRKAQNLKQNPYCTVCTENAAEAVILEGVARRLPDSEIPAQAFIDYRAKYGWELDPGKGLVFEVRPRAIFAMPEEQFPDGATRWSFG
jgi:hypothetical protein